MRWILHGAIEPQAAEVLKQRGDVIVDPAALEAGTDDVSGFVRAAQRAQLDILTCDSSLVDAIYASGFPFQRCVIFLQAVGAEQELSVMRLFERYKRLTPARLYTVTASRVKVRQLPGAS